MPNNYLTVSELNYYLHRLIADDNLIKGMRLMGEVSGLSLRDNYLFFTIKDSDSQISVVKFGDHNYVPVNGDKVILTGTPEIYQKSGKLNFKAYNIEPFGLGDIHIELENRKKRLREEGLFEPQYKKPIPKYPKSVCVVTSVNGAVIKDIVSTVRKYNKSINITAIDCRVQGENAVKSIINGLLAADSLNFDVIILARGGGSFEDLYAYNDETLARVIFSLDTPIISAVGHETDFSIADFVADLRALTPTAAAETIAYDEKELELSIINKLKTAKNTLEFRLDNNISKTVIKSQEISYLINNKLDLLTRNINKALTKIEAATTQNINSKEKTVGDILSKLSLLNPAEILQKGYFKVSKNGKNVTRISELYMNDEFTLLDAKAQLKARVIEKQNI